MGLAGPAILMLISCVWAASKVCGKASNNITHILTAVKNGQGYGDNDHFPLEMGHIGVGVVDLAGGEVQQPSVLTLQHQLQQEQSPQAQPLS